MFLTIIVRNIPHNQDFIKTFKTTSDVKVLFYEGLTLEIYRCVLWTLNGSIIFVYFNFEIQGVPWVRVRVDQFPPPWRDGPHDGAMYVWCHSRPVQLVELRGVIETWAESVHQVLNGVDVRTQRFVDVQRRYDESGVSVYELIVDYRFQFDFGYGGRLLAILGEGLYDFDGRLVEGRDVCFIENSWEYS